MKFFFSYKFSGEIIDVLHTNINPLLEIIRSSGNTVYCSLEDELWFREKSRTNKEIMEHAFAKIDKSDYGIVFLNSNEKSEGVLMEIGYMIAKNKPFLLLKNRNVNLVSVDQLAKRIIVFNTSNDLGDNLNIFLKELTKN